MPISMLGQTNVSALSVPQALVQIVPPQFLFGGASTNTGGFVGAASWGPVNLAQSFGSYAQYSAIFGPTINRTYDMGGHVILAQAQGAAYFYGVRVTDGTDVAASVTILTNCLTLTGKYTGTLGNQISATTAPGTQSGTYKIILSNPYLPPEIFDNIGQGVSSVTVTAGTGYTSVPSAAVTLAPAGGVNAVVYPTLSVAGTPTLGVGGAGYVANDTITLSNGVVLKVLTVTSGAVATFSVQSAGSITGGATPTNPVAQVSTSGSGTGATFNLTWGLGTPTIAASGSGYTVAPTITLSGGGGGSGGSYVAILAPWLNMANAINNGGSSVRPSSNMVVATAGVGSTMPASASYTLTGGSDGVAGITTSKLIGVDTVPRSGMYALRGTPISRFMLCDLSDTTSFSTQLPFAQSMSAEAICCTAASDTLTNASAEAATIGVDNPWLKIIFGDWVIWLDTVTNSPQRLSSPQSVLMGLRCNLSPQESSLNKPINGIIGTQSSMLGKTYSYSDFQTLAAARMDVLALDISLSNSFVFRLGQNTSSNPVTNDDSYTDVTNFLAKSIYKIAVQYLGQTTTPTSLRQSKVALQAFLQLTVSNGIIGTFDGSQAYQVVSDTSNNTQATVALGYRYAYAKAVYFGITKYFIINLEGGASVTVSDTLPGQ